MRQSHLDQESCGKPSSAPPDPLIVAAQAGCSKSLGTLADRYRRYLLMVAHSSLSPALKAKVGASDIVQETLLHFQSRFDRFVGNTEEELLTWLRRILYFRALQAARRYGGTVARDLRRELSLVDLSEATHELPLIDPDSTPCTSLLNREQLTALDAAIASLPTDYQQVIRLRNLERQNFRAIGETVGCTEDAARKRWIRALAALRERMTGGEPPAV